MPSQRNHTGPPPSPPEVPWGADPSSCSELLHMLGGAVVGEYPTDSSVVWLIDGTLLTSAWAREMPLPARGAVTLYGWLGLHGDLGAARILAERLAGQPVYQVGLPTVFAERLTAELANTRTAVA